MTVFENVAFGLRVRPKTKRPSKSAIAEKVHQLLSLVQLDWLADRYPSQLSGGQRQRIALARALAVEPQVLLLDEPFGALDVKVRKELRRWLRRLHDDIHITSVFVTHDQEEALEVADRIVIMNEGAIEQIGSPEEVYEHPVTPFVYHFLGNVNLFHGRIHAGRARLGDMEIETPEHADAHDVPAIGYVRPHDIEVARHRNGVPALTAVVQHVHPIGPLVHLELTRGDTGEVIAVDVSKERYQELQLQEGEKVFVTTRNLRVFIRETPSREGPACAETNTYTRQQLFSRSFNVCEPADRGHLLPRLLLSSLWKYAALPSHRTPVERIYLNPPEAVPSFAGNKVDAWSIWSGPHEVTEVEHGARPIFVESDEVTKEQRRDVNSFLVLEAYAR
jgi:sulfate transport system ATP-binding protein